MARRSISIDEKIEQQKKVVFQLKDRYDAALDGLRKSRQKLIEERNKAYEAGFGGNETKEERSVAIKRYRELEDKIGKYDTLIELPEIKLANSNIYKALEKDLSSKRYTEEDDLVGPLITQIAEYLISHDESLIR